MFPFKAYVQLKNTSHTSKEGHTFIQRGDKQVFEVEDKSLDAAWCTVYNGVKNVQRVLIPID